MGNDCDDSDPELNPSTTWYRDDTAMDTESLLSSCSSALHLMVTLGLPATAHLRMLQHIQERQLLSATIRST